MKAELIPENGDPPIVIAGDLTVIGRREGCDVRIDHPGLSKRHCIVVKTDGLLVVRDLASTNGTKVKGQRVRWAALMPGDRLTLGGYRAKVYLGPDNQPSPSEGGAASAVPAAPFPAPLHASHAAAPPRAPLLEIDLPMGIELIPEDEPLANWEPDVGAYVVGMDDLIDLD